MKKFYVNEISKMSGLSVATLHYYDGIGLLKPSLRLENNYRLYSEVDLIKLEKIIAMKFFGFSIKDIKKLTYAESIDICSELGKQANYLADQARDLANASERIKDIISSNSGKNKVIDWTTISKMIEVYKMTDKLRQTWVKEVLNEDERKQYAEFKAELKRTNKQDEASKIWSKLVEEIRANINQDPASDKSQSLASKTMNYLNNLYGTENANLKKSIWEKGYKQGKVKDENGFTADMTVWLDKALGHYWRNLIYTTLALVGKIDESNLLKQWNKILIDMYGTQQTPKDELYEKAMKDNKISEEAKKWLMRVMKK